MIISASRRTDIPAFYAEWFVNRIREGYLCTRNPFNTHQVRRIDLSPGSVDVIVFWTKNPEPIMACLDELDERGYRYYFQFTLTAYPGVLEPGLPPLSELLSTFKELGARIGPEKVIWRFDPIVLSDVTPEPAVIEAFCRLARELAGATTRAVISFVHLYGSVKRTLDRIGLRFYDAERTREQIERIATALAKAARANSMEIESCASQVDMSGLGIRAGKCIDDLLIKRLFGIAVSDRKDRYQRGACRCVESRDIGQYNTCVHDCVYCYAGSNKAQARRNRALHDPASPFLIGKGPEESPAGTTQVGLFSEAHL